ncbi:MAG: dephospho-CoA kinase [Hyphomonadaceae bacterium]|jgi:dephospho-CoA kinase|uniref:dephospho-CoA kinase n=1 Tax=Aquidulcibacter sp. TaxID=2052990 RepID=UPI0022C24582|nr:dephospho-CoA kinase [Aquidulcibacter sp.]MCE2890415.1 dephospho-CoA kinase [Hyphomonadaceae bacterium]MCZ8206976.1 dephospho-CoA kinase [Aquidulcibacter sp.]
MKIVALTGSIGMGKSTTSAMFKDLGVPIWDADAAVHRLYAPDGAAIPPLKALIPEAVGPAGVDRTVLTTKILQDPGLLKQIEAIVHPLVGKDRADFLAAAREQGAPLVMVDVPLLFETGGEAYVDAVIVVSCPPDMQRGRVVARPGMTEEKFESILARQTPDEVKRAKSDFVIETGLGLDAAREQVGKVHAALLSQIAQGAEE